MASCEPTQSYKIPLKACRNSVIQHNLVTIGLSVEWPERGGDDPTLVIDITNKQPSTPYVQQNPSSSPVNSVHHHPYQHHENVGSIYQQQYYHTSAINNHDLSNSTTTSTIGDHDDVSSTTTTTTVIYNSTQPQIQPSASSAAIQRIKTDLKSQLSALPRRQQTFNEQNLSSQHVIQIPPVNMNDPRFDMKMSTISPTSSIKSLSSVITPYFEFQQPSTMVGPPSTLKPSSIKSLICTCPNPTISHVRDCAIFASNNQESITNFSSELIHRLPIKQTNISRVASVPQTHINTAISIPSMREPMITTTLVPFPNPNLMKTIDSSSHITTTISQPPSFLNNTQISPTIKLSPSSTDHNFQPSSFNFPQVLIKNPSNCPTNPSIPMPTFEQQSPTSKNSNRRKKLPKNRNSSTSQDQIPLQNPINSQQQQQQNIHPPSLRSSPIQTQQGMFIFQDNSQITDNTLCGSTNDIQINTVQQSSPHTNPNVRSPVKIDIPGSENLNQPKRSPEEMVDETICEVVEGKGNISLLNSSTSTTSPQRKSSVSTPHSWESNGPTTTTRRYSSPVHQIQQSLTYDSNISTLNRPSFGEMIQQVIRPNFTEQSPMNTLTAMNNNKKRNGSKSMNNSGPKRAYKPTIKRKQQTTITTSVTSTPSSWRDIPIGNSNQHLITDSLQIQDINQNGTMMNYSVINNGQIHIIHPNYDHQIELDDIFSPAIDEFPSSTPPHPLSSVSISSQLLDSESAAQSSNTFILSLTNPNDVYDDYFPHALPSSSTWEENQVTSSVLTPPDAQNNQLLQQQYYSPNDPSLNTNLQSQVRVLSDVQS
jgi:hypothetical protein